LPITKDWFLNQGNVIASVTWPKRPFFRAETVENTVTKNQQLRGPFLGSVSQQSNLLCTSQRIASAKSASQ
jgi:hypothetical protein